jgi:hypothetical protein
MNRLRCVAGLLAAAWLILSSAVHSILGWKQLHGSLAAAKVPAELILGVKAGWQFAGIAMLAFGIIAFAILLKAYRGENVSVFPVVIIGAAYTAFGAWALFASGWDLFFLIFLIPGVVLLLAVPGRRVASRSPAP